MGWLALILGGVIGYNVSDKLTAKNWIMKLCYGLFAPLTLIIVVFVIIGLITGSGYLAGSYGAPLVIGCIPYILIVLVRMKIK